ncbi:MAG: HD domain-containing protein [Pleomorphochaeta sp.]
MKTTTIRDKMIEFYKGDPRRINHFLKVEAYATLIAEREKVSDDIYTIISILGYIHDIGIKYAEEKYNNTSGKLQEQLGKEPSRNMVIECGFSKAIADRVSYVVSHHHTYENIDGIDYQILVEADIIVNFFEDNLAQTILPSIKKNIFKTKTGLYLLDALYLK